MNYNVEPQIKEDTWTYKSFILQTLMQIYGPNPYLLS